MDYCSWKKNAGEALIEKMTIQIGNEVIFDSVQDKQQRKEILDKIEYEFYYYKKNTNNYYEKSVDELNKIYNLINYL